MERGAGFAEDGAGSRRARKKERTRRAIYAAALGLFRERGVDAVTIEEICARADVARGTFFLHYPAKTALLFEYGRVLAAQLAGALADERESAAAQFRRVAESLVASWSEHGDAVRGLLRELLGDPEALRSARAEAPELPALVAGVVRRGQLRGEFRDQVAPAVVAAAFLASALALLATSRRRERVREELVDLVLHGLVAPAVRGARA